MAIKILKRLGNRNYIIEVGKKKYKRKRISKIEKDRARSYFIVNGRKYYDDVFK